MTNIQQSACQSINRMAFNSLSKREYFAGVALQGILANERNIGIEIKEKIDIAVEYADELMNKLNEWSNK